MSRLRANIREVLSVIVELIGFGLAAWGLSMWTGEPGAGLLLGGASLVLLAAMAGPDDGGEE